VSHRALASGLLGGRTALVSGAHGGAALRGELGDAPFSFAAVDLHVTASLRTGIGSVGFG
jgi:hypothetical protein